jgi:poly-gamma-glutamate synthesis protein (capsule biosynthesis protein)
MGIDFVGAANNHTLDFGTEGMVSTLENLDRVGIGHAGAGADLAVAASPGYIDTAVGRVGQVNCASTFPPFFAAGPAHPYLRGRPGLNPVRLDQTFQLDRKLFEQMKKAEETFYDLLAYNEFPFPDSAKPPKDQWFFGERQIQASDRIGLQSVALAADLARVTDAVKVARNNSRLVVASIHAHEARHTLEIADPFFQPFARACIDAGADAFFAAGPHVIRGIEIYRGKPIFYCLSNFFFQIDTFQPVPAEDFAAYGLDPRTLDPSLFGGKIFYNEQKRFWRSFVPRITYEEGKVAEIEIHPVSLGFGQPIYERGFPTLARGAEAAEILADIAARSRPYGTTMAVEEGVGRIVLGEKKA